MSLKADSTNGISSARLERLRTEAQRMVVMDSPASDREYWSALLSALTELQERRAEVAK